RPKDCLDQRGMMGLLQRRPSRFRRFQSNQRLELWAVQGTQYCFEPRGRFRMASAGVVLAAGGVSNESGRHAVTLAARYAVCTGLKPHDPIGGVHGEIGQPSHPDSRAVIPGLTFDVLNNPTTDHFASRSQTSEFFRKSSSRKKIARKQRNSALQYKFVQSVSAF